MVIAVVEAALVALGLRVREAEEALARAPHIYTVSILDTKLVHFATVIMMLSAVPSPALTAMHCRSFSVTHSQKAAGRRMTTASFLLRIAEYLHK